jgi:beta-lactamase superfamily II metal-dependent hydrolase
MRLLWLGLSCLLAASLSDAGAAKNLEIYFIDVEGGKAVLFVSPSGESMLIDAGWPATNNIPDSSDRIVEAARAAGVKRIDYLVISHFDVDHIGDVPLLASKIPIVRVFDHGEIKATAAGAARAEQRFAPYRAFREKIPHKVVQPGDRIPVKGIDVRVVSAGGRLITKPLAGAARPNPLCATNPQADALESDVEDDQSVGLVIASGKFRMLDLADLEAHLSHDLVCPNNLIGTVDVYNVNVHGQFKGIAPGLVGAVKAPAVIQANGVRKGADAKTWPVLTSAPGVVDIWQLHYSQNGGKDENPPDNFIANPEGADGYKWIRISASSGGEFTITNSRNGYSKHYAK